MKDETEYVSGIESTEGALGRSCKFRLFITVPVMNSLELPRKGSRMINDHQTVDKDARGTDWNNRNDGKVSLKSVHRLFTRNVPATRDSSN